jgi:hypothetical protein
MVAGPWMVAIAATHRADGQCTLPACGLMLSSVLLPWSNLLKYNNNDTAMIGLRMDKRAARTFMRARSALQ